MDGTEITGNVHSVTEECGDQCDISNAYDPLHFPLINAI